MRDFKAIFFIIYSSININPCFSQVQSNLDALIKDQLADSGFQTKIIQLGLSSTKKFRGECEFPKELFKILELEEIYLYGLPIEKIPKEILNFKHLKVLFISNAKMRVLPPELSQLDSLNSLYIIEGKLNSIPRTIGNLRNLTSLSIQGNKEFNYDSIGFYLRNTNLTELCFGNKRFKKLDSSFLNLQSLEYIQISYGNKIDYYSLVQTLNQLKGLKKIAFNECRFSMKEVQLLEKIRPNVKLQFINCNTPKNSINNLKLKLQDTNEVIIGYRYKAKSYGSF